MDNTLYDAYTSVTSQNLLYQRNRDRWQFLLESYIGGEEYRRGEHLTRYVTESDGEYASRLLATPLDNHCRSVIQVYTSFLFREQPDRDYGSLEMNPNLEPFLSDCDQDGRSLDAFMRDVAIWSNVFGHAWVMVVKPNTNVATRAAELAQGVRPYLNLITPLTVVDWEWRREASGAYTLVYFKYVEEANDSFSTIKEWTTEEIRTTQVNHTARTIVDEVVEPNQLGMIPAVICYGTRSPVRGIGASTISDIADIQRLIYNLTSEAEQSIRINGHPTLVKTVDVEASAGAGSIALMPDGMDPGLKPYLLNVSTDISQIYTSISALTDSIDKIANTGAVRAVAARSTSGVAMETEFQLLNARLSELADNLELAEEQIWRLFAIYEGTAWDGEIEYPDSFNIRDHQRDVSLLVSAKSAATDEIVLRVIDEELLEALGREKEYLTYQDPVPQPGRTYPDGSVIPDSLPAAYQPASNPDVPPGQACANCEYYKAGDGYCYKFDAVVREDYWCAKWEYDESSGSRSVMTPALQAEIQQELMSGRSNLQIMARHPGITVNDIAEAAAAAARNN